MSIRKKLVRSIDVPFVCAYCGEPAQDREHVYPRSIVGNNTPIVWSCKECNNFAGAILFDSFEEKLEYIHKAIFLKYKKQLSFPNLDDDEIKELGRTLRTKVKSAMREKTWVMNRLSWKTSLHVLVVA